MLPPTKVVQTRLQMNLYEVFQRTADAKGISLMDAANEAIRRWVMEETDFAGSPLFDPRVVLGKGPRTDSSDDDSTLYRRRKPRGSSSTRVRS